jgi:chaperone modulatory protein CbpM
MTKDLEPLLSGDVLRDDMELTLVELCRTCHLPVERVCALVDEGIIEPLGRGEPAGWRFRWISVRRVRCALRLERDLGVNLAGAALALELLEELNRLRARQGRFD